jgi:hypothetical protein
VALSPDKFVCDLFDRAQDKILAVMQYHRQQLKKPPKSAAEYIATLEQCGLREFASRLTAFQDKI